MKRAFVQALLFASTVALFGCGTVGPHAPAELRSKAVQVVPADEGEAMATEPANWQPNTRGFTAIRRLGIPQNPIAGVFVLTATNVYFTEWDSSNERYHIVKRIPTRGLKEAFVDTFGRNEALVLQSEDFETHTFQFTGVFSQAVEKGKAREVQMLLPESIRR